MLKALALFIAVLFAVRLVIAQMPPPVINLDAGPHTITAEIHCDGDRVTTIDIFVDGKYLLTTTSGPLPPGGLRITR